jgi:uncharacterized protein
MKPDDFHIKIAEIGESGLDLERPIAPAWFAETLGGPQGAAPELALDESVPATVRVHLDKAGQDVVVRGRIEGRGKTPCGRCLGDAAVDLGSDLDVLFTCEPARAADAEDGDDDKDVERHDGVTLDLEGPVREAMILAVPLAPLCREDCRGLCNQCGQDLNQDECEHSRNGVVDIRFAGLQKLKLGLPS